MVLYQFDVSVKVQSDDCPQSNEAILGAGRYLAYADQTDTFGMDANIKEVFTNLEDGDWIVTVRFVVPMMRDRRTRFVEELSRLSRTTGVTFTTNLTNPNN